MDETKTKFVPSLKWNGNEYIDDENGCYIFVYDEFEKSLVCIRKLKVDETGKCIIQNIEDWIGFTPWLWYAYIAIKYKPQQRNQVIV